MNKVKIKYVNMTNAVDYACEKYHVRNGKELEYIWECYMDAVKQKKFEQNSDDIDYFNNRMIGNSPHIVYMIHGYGFRRQLH